MLMANAPAPRAYPKEYNDLEVSIVNEEVVVNEYTSYNYTYHIKNTGVGYISHVSISNTKRDKDGYYTFYAFLDNESFNPIFRDCVIAPHAEIDVINSLYNKINDITDIKWTAQAFYDFDNDVTVSGSLNVAKEPRWNGYVVDMALNNKNDAKYEYGTILKLTYDSNEFYVHVNEFDGFVFATSDDFDLNKLTKVEVVEVTRSVRYGYGCNNAMNVIKAVVITLFICFLLLASGGIFCAIYFPLKKRKKKQNEKA